MTTKVLAESKLQEVISFGEKKFLDAIDSVSVENPSDTSAIGNIPILEEGAVKRRIALAQQCFESFSRTTLVERAAVLERVAAEILANRSELAALLTLEQGKVVSESLAEVDYSAAYFSWYASQLAKPAGYTSTSKDGKSIYVTYEPIGVTAAITPWNFLSAMISRKVAASIAAGCPMLVKPGLNTPFSAIALQQIIESVSGEESLMQCVPGKAEEVARTFFTSSEIKKISFTGSTNTGRKLIQAASYKIKRLTLELGGNAPCLVFDDADLELTIQESIAAKFRNAGQTCICINRFLVQKHIFDKFQDGLASAAGKIIVGDGFDPLSTMGPLINAQGCEKVRGIYQNAIAAGAKESFSEKFSSNALGHFVTPIVLSTSDHKINGWSEEIFGPIAILYPFDTEDAAISMANDVSAGLAAYVFTRDHNRATRVANSLQYGMVGINTGKISRVELPFGGIKESGWGREGGIEGLQEYQNIKAVVL